MQQKVDYQTYIIRQNTPFGQNALPPALPNLLVRHPFQAVDLVREKADTQPVNNAFVFIIILLLALFILPVFCFALYRFVLRVFTLHLNGSIAGLLINLYILHTRNKLLNVFCRLSTLLLGCFPALIFSFFLTTFFLVVVIVDRALQQSLDALRCLLSGNEVIGAAAQPNAVDVIHGGGGAMLANGGGGGVVARCEVHETRSC